MKIETKQLLLMGAILILGAVSLGKLGYDVVPVARAEDSLALGEAVYRDNCAACHGEKGDGKGSQADRLKTKPRDFTGGIYKFRSTPSGSLPLDSDLERTVTTGIRGTSMLAQRHLSQEETRAVVQYLKSVSPRFKNGKPPLAIIIPRSRPQLPAWSRLEKLNIRKVAAPNVMARLAEATVRRRKTWKTIGATESRQQT
jgi:mono/diheme cytochrome c family protein